MIYARQARMIRNQAVETMCEKYRILFSFDWLRNENVYPDRKSNVLEMEFIDGDPVGPRLYGYPK